MSEEIIDLADVMMRVQDDKELLLELFDIFQEDFLKRRQALGDSLVEGDLTKVKESVHSIKGSSGNISAKQLYATALQFEMLAKSNTTTGMLELLKSIDEQFERLKVEMARLKKEWAA